MGLERAYRLEGDHRMGGKPQRYGTIFYGGSWPLKTPCKYFNFAVGGGMEYMKWLKKVEQGKILYFMQLFLHNNILYGENFIG